MEIDFAAELDETYASCEFCGSPDHKPESPEDCPNHDQFAVESWNER